MKSVSHPGVVEQWFYGLAAAMSVSRSVIPLGARLNSLLPIRSRALTLEDAEDNP